MEAKITPPCVKATEEVNQIISNLNSNTTQYKALARKYNFAKLALSNLKQDLSTLRLLFTNLKFDPAIKFEHSQTYSYFDNLSDCFSKCEKEVDTISTYLEKVTSFSEEGFRNGLELYADIINKIEIQLNYIKNTQKQADRYKSQLENIEEEKNSSTSEIITKLQFQDILRQKIEHIQEAHQHITESLFDSHNENEEIRLEDLYKIRDITSLQSAQLIHANKEYQTAVETILLKISVLKQVANNYKTIWQQFFSPELLKLKETIENIEREREFIETQSNALNQLFDKYRQLAEEVLNTRKLLHKKIKSKLCEKNDTKELENLIQNIILEKELKETYSPIKQLKAELTKFHSGYKKLLDILNNLNEDIPDQVSSHMISTYNFIQIEKTTNLIIEVIENQKQLFSKNNIELDFSGIKDDFGIEEIAYYKSFEKEVKVIISELDNLLESINVNREDINPETLEELRRMYTMNSERDIHDAVLNKGRKEKKQDHTDDDVEFF
jgi:hypothetical protein